MQDACTGMEDLDALAVAMLHHGVMLQAGYMIWQVEACEDGL